MNVIEKLVKKYFSKNSSPEERKDSYESLMDNQAEFSRYFSEEEWNAFINSDTELKEEETGYPENTYKPTKNKKVVLYKRMAYAAAAFIILVSTFLINKLNTQNNKPAVAEQTFKDSAGLIVRINASPDAEKILLSDSSVVELFAGSKITYLKNFESDRRNMQLEGAATFKIFKNSQRPFTVVCKEVATTALGTKFKISNSRSGKVIVELMEGKIVVRRSGKEVNNNEQYYLLPGNAISFDRPKNMFTKIYSTITGNDNKAPSIAARQQETATLPKAAENVSEHRIETTTSVQFNGEMLPKVLDYMSVVYKVKIIYPTKYISRIRFVGSVHKHEDIRQILQNIVMMNDLELKRDTANNVFIIQIPSR